MAVLTAVSILLAVNQVFNLGFFVGYVLLDSRYMYLITGVMLSMVFVTFPATKHSPRHVPWYDILIMLLIAGVFAYFAFYAERIVLEAWEYAAPPVGVWLALLTWAIVMEAGRRAGGWPVFTIVALFSLYPTFADKLPNVIAALSIPVQDVAMFHVMGAESLFGIPMQVFAQMVFGFLVFGVSLQYTGGGPFFINLAFALLGHKRGGPAKVSIFSSGLMGSMSGGPHQQRAHHRTAVDTGDAAYRLYAGIRCGSRSLCLHGGRAHAADYGRDRLCDGELPQYKLCHRGDSGDRPFAAVFLWAFYADRCACRPR
jgi:TRAP-type uncharacterized transport system fused permease subunit